MGDRTLDFLNNSFITDFLSNNWQKNIYEICYHGYENIDMLYLDVTMQAKQ